MENNQFDELLASIQEGGQILRGEREPQRRFEVRQIRKRPNASQRGEAGRTGPLR